MKKQPQQPEQQRSDYSASAPNSRPDRASGDRGAVLEDFEELLGRMKSAAQGTSRRAEMCADELIDAFGSVRRAVGHDASSEPRQNPPNDAVAVREALAELVRLHELLLTANPQHLARMPTYIKQVINDPAWSAARALLDEEGK